MQYSKLDIELMIGLDDMAHNRLYSMEGDEFIPVPNWGKRNPKEKCYCKILRKLGVRR